MENKNQKHKNQFLSKQTLGPLGWRVKKWEGTKTDFNQKNKNKMGDGKWGDEGKVEW